MKINYKILSLFLLTIFFIGCGDDDKSTTEPELQLQIDQALVGTWELTNVIASLGGTVFEQKPEDLGLASVSVFSSDGSFQSTNTDSDGTVVDTGTWGVSDGVLYITITGEETETTPYTLIGNVVTIESTIPVEGIGEVPATLQFTKQN